MDQQLTVGVLMSRVRVEEKLLLEQLERRGVRILRFDDREFTLDLHKPWEECDVVLERCINHLRALYTLRVLNDWGIPTVNTYEVASTCGDKLLTSSALAQAGVPIPRTILALRPRFGVGGDRGDRLSGRDEAGRSARGGGCSRKINDRDAAEAILEHKDDARLVPPRHLLYPGVCEEAGPRHPRVRGRR